MKKQIYTAVGLILATLGFISQAASGGNGASEIGEQRQKARYYYLEGAEESAGDNMDAAYSLFKKAYETDPSYDEAADAYATFQMYVIPQDGSPEADQAWEECVNLRRRIIDSYPGDYAAVRVYAQQIMAQDPARRLNGKPIAAEVVRVLERLDSIGAPTSYHLIQLSQAYSALEMPDSVMGALRRFERREGSSPELLEKKVGLLFDSGATERAVKEIDEYRKEHPREEYPLVLMSMVKYAEGKPDSTLYYLREGEKLNPHSFDLKHRIALLSYEQGDTVTFENKIFEAIEESDGSREDKITLFTQYLSNHDSSATDRAGTAGDDSRIREAVSSLHGQYPQDSFIYLIEGGIESEAGNDGKAEELIRRAVSLNPEGEKEREMLVQHLLRSGKEDEALAEIKKACKEVGPLPSLRSPGVYLSVNSKDYPMAISLLEEALKEKAGRTSLVAPISLDEEFIKNLSYPEFMDLAMIYQEAGDVYHNMDEAENMIRCYENALVLGPNVPMTLNNYAYYLTLANRNLDRADEMSQRAIILEPGNPTFLDTRGWVLFKRGETNKAEEVLRETISIYDNRIEDSRGVPVDDEKNEERSGSEALTEAVQEIEEEMTEALIHYGAALWVNGKKEEARQQWKRVLKIDPDNKDAAVYMKEGWKEEYRYEEKRQ